MNKQHKATPKRAELIQSLLEAEALLQRFEFNSDGYVRLHPSEKEVEDLRSKLRSLRVEPLQLSAPTIPSHFEGLSSAKEFLQSLASLGEPILMKGGRIKGGKSDVLLFPKPFEEELHVLERQIPKGALSCFHPDALEYKWYLSNLVLLPLNVPPLLNPFPAFPRKPYHLAAYLC